ncbi:MAG: hypothetical protein IJ292_03370 [Clostridia bacterium]|nr:hypothetical protein [Clostridia bacterium]
MKKIISRSKIALMTVIAAVVMVLSIVSVSAAPVADAGIANDTYANAVTLSGNTVDALHEAMVKVETEKVDVIFTLTSNIVLNPGAVSTYTVGTDAESANKLIITGNGAYGIILGGKANLHIKGNVQFKNIILRKTETGTKVGDYRVASYIFVTEGKGIFGDAADSVSYGNITNPTKTDRKTTISLAGSDIEVYSGYYMVVAANCPNSMTDVDSPEIVFGGNAETENLAGRCACTGEYENVIGTSTVTVKGNAKITNYLTAGHFRPVVSGDTNLSGNAILNMTGGTVENLSYVTYITDESNLANYNVDKNTRSQYTVNVEGGAINYLMMCDIKAKVALKGVDTTLNLGNANYGKERIIVGPWVRENGTGVSVTDCKVTANINNASFGGAFVGGCINIGTSSTNKVVLDVDLDYNIGNTGKVTFNSDVIFGTYIKDIAAYSEHRGDVQVKLWAANSNIIYNWIEMYAGSMLEGQGSKHTGDTYIELVGNPGASFNNKAIYAGSYMVAGGTEHSGTSKYVAINADSVNTSLQIFGGSKIADKGIHSGDSFVIVLSGAQGEDAGNSGLLNEGFVLGGSYLCANGAEHSGNSKVVLGDKATNNKATVKQDIFGGSYVTVSEAEHSGKSEVICDYSTITEECWVLGGSYLKVSGAVQTGASALTVNDIDATSSNTISFFGGSYILVDGARHEGSSTFELNAGTMNNVHGAGSYAAMMATDKISDDGINGGFAQGNVYYIVNGGIITTIPYIAGYNVNVDGDINVIITGGTIGDGTTKDFSTLNNDKTKSVSVTGDLKLKISGGNLNFNIIHNGSLNSSAAAGVDVVKGTYYTEFVGNEMVFTPVSGTAPTQFYPVGYNNVAANFAGSSLYIRLGGDFDHFNEGTLQYNFTSRVNHLTGDKIIDYVQWTKNGQLSAIGRGETIYRPMNGQTVNVDRIEALGEDAKLSDYTLKAGDILTWSYGGKEISATYEALTKYNHLSDNKNEIKLVDAETLEDFTIATRALKLKCGTVYSVEFACSNAAIADFIVLEYCKVKGASLRANNLAMRCRVEISKDFFANFFEENKTNAKEYNGYKVKKIGILASGINDFSDANDRIVDAVAWENNEIKTGGKGWAIDDDGNYYFAAAITEYINADGLINAETIKRTVYFKAYVDLSYGEKIIRVYLDNPDSVAPAMSYGSSLVEAMFKLIEEYEAKDPDTVEWFEEKGGQKTVDSILAVLGHNQYTFTVADGAAWCGDYTVNHIQKLDEDTIVYRLEFDVNKDGYVVTDVKGVEKCTKVRENTFDVQVSGNTSINLSYARKLSTTLEERRDKVVDKMKEITGIQYMVDRQYSFTRGNKTITLIPGTIYQGMPYSDKATFSPDAFKDFIDQEKTAENGFTTMVFTVDNPDFFPGNTCADAVYWAWASVASEISFPSASCITSDFGAHVLGDIDYSSGISGSYWKDTGVVCANNGLTAMADAYALMSKGDALVYKTDTAGQHIILVSEVHIVPDSYGYIDASKSYILYHDQNGGYRYITGHNGREVYTSCAYDQKITFTRLYEKDYLPVTCEKLSDENSSIDPVAFIDTYNKYSYDNVTEGEIITNYALSKIEMVITNMATNQVYKAVRYGYESPRLRFQMASFCYNYGDNNKVDNVYDDVIIKEDLPSGTYSCLVTGYFSNGETETIRNFTFTK